ncbi:prepilin-type N-terminal cleavage/methylation domain-containing protein [Persephonella sp.]
MGFRMKSEEGFTLLEVLVAVVILAVSLTVLLQVKTNQIRQIADQFERLDALQFYKKKSAGLPVEDRFILKIEKTDLLYGIKEVNNIIINRKTGKTVLNFRSYERN